MEFMCMSQAMIEFSCILLLHTSKGNLIQVEYLCMVLQEVELILID